LSGGLAISKDQAETYLEKSGIAADKRAEDLSITQWLSLLKSGILDA
jgi:16S rRNA A1518/A1519 N6-dimethyltransferase RsmA/KsgA/DIM1 with predicted DNA glycosylase/AP lyase activity